MKKNALVLILISFSLSAAFSQAIVRTQISSSPSGAAIYVDGSHIGQTPMEFRFRDGKMYKVELRKNNYCSESFNYRGGSGNINRRLEQIPPPKSYRDHNKMASPSYEENRRHDKRHNDRYEQPSRRPNDYEYDRRKPPKHRYNNRRYMLTVTSDIPRAEVIIDNKFAGRTPLKIELEKGMHDIFVNLPGHRDYYEQVDLERDKDIFIRFR